MAAPLAGQAGAVLRDLALRSARLRGSFPVSEPGSGRRVPAGPARGWGAGGGLRAAHLALRGASPQEPPCGSAP